MAKINAALSDNRFRLFYQPIVPISNQSEGEHYELLIRMLDENDKVVPPGAFLPAAERYNLSSKLDEWVIRTALCWLSDHPESLQSLHLCGINLSGPTMCDKDLPKLIQRLLEETGVPARKICFEVTETAAIASLGAATQFIRELRDCGCHFALDDFGSGLSSFAYLKNLPVDF